MKFLVGCVNDQNIPKKLLLLHLLFFQMINFAYSSLTATLYSIDHNTRGVVPSLSGQSGLMIRIFKTNCHWL